MTRGSVWVLATIAIAQIVAVSHTFPVSELLSDKPLFYIDGPMHWYRVVGANNVMDDGQLEGYDPFFYGGSRIGPTHRNAAAKIPSLTGAVLDPALNSAQVWKLYSFLAALIGPVCVVLACQAWQLGWRETALVGILAVLLWWLSYFRWLHTAGLVSFVCGAFLGLFYFALVCRYLLQNRLALGWVLALGLFAAFGLLMHPLFGIPVALGTLVFLAFHWRHVFWRQTVVCVLVVPAIAFACNWFWLESVFSDVGARASGSQPIPSVTHMANVDLNIVWRELLGIWDSPAMGSKAYPLIALGLLGGLLIRSERLRQLVLTLAVTGIVLVLYAAVGASSDLLAVHTQPNRFSPVGYLFFLPAAGIGLVALWDHAHQVVTPRIRVLALGGIATATLLGLVNLNELRRELSYADHGHYGVTPPEVKGIGEDSQFVLRWLKAYTSPDQRVLFEVANGRVHDDGHMAGFYAYTSQREFIGGPYPFHGINFWDSVLVDRPIDQWTSGELARFFELYNIGWAVVHSNEAKRAFAGLAASTLLSRFREFEFYAVDSTPSFFLEGTGRVVSRDHNDLRLEELEGDRIIIKYNFERGLKAKPPTEIEPIDVDGAFRPFILLLDPPDAVRLSLDD